MPLIASSTTSDAALVGKTRRPFGLGRRGPVCCVAASGRCEPWHRLRRRALHPGPRRPNAIPRRFSYTFLDAKAADLSSDLSPRPRIGSIIPHWPWSPLGRRAGWA
mgnify:FL=1